MAHLKKFASRLANRLKPKVLQVVGIKDEMFSEVMGPSDKVQGLTGKVREFYLPSLKMTAAAKGLGSLSAPQVGVNQAMFVMHQDLVDGQWNGYKADSSQYIGYVNPTILAEAGGLEADWEKCCSIDCLEAKVDRLQKVIVEYLREDGEFVTESLSGFKGRVFQHEVDHIWGFLISNYTVSEGNLRFKGSFPRAKQVLEDFKFKAEDAKHRLEQRYLTDPRFKQEADETEDKPGFILRRVIDEEFEQEFTNEFYGALVEDLNSGG